MQDRWFLVELSLERIRESLSRADATRYDIDYVRAWLRDAGFREQGSAWLVREADLGQVDPSEVRQIEIHDPPPRQDW